MSETHPPQWDIRISYGQEMTEEEMMAFDYEGHGGRLFRYDRAKQRTEFAFILGEDSPQQAAVAAIWCCPELSGVEEFTVAVAKVPKQEIKEIDAGLRALGFTQEELDAMKVREPA